MRAKDKIMENSGNQPNAVYLTGAITTLLVLAGIVLDMVAGTITGGDISALPQTAVERFSQIHNNTILGLYNLDLLNMINQIILIPSIFAIYLAHKKTDNGFALLALILFLTGTVIFISGNTALTMYDLSNKYYSAASETQKILLAAAGESMLAKGAHGSLGVFTGFVLPTLANLMMSYVMLRGRIFPKAGSYIGIAGNALMVLYLVMVTFYPATEKYALMIAMPGGLLVMTWMIMFMTRLFRLGRQRLR